MPLSATENSLLTTARKAASDLSFRERCRVVIYIGIARGLPTTWVRFELEGPPNYADGLYYRETWDNGIQEREID